MFTEEGVWKEFGIGRDSTRYTWLPFWLFCILWALISYILSLIIFRFMKGPSVQLYEEEVVEIAKPSKTRIRRGSTLPEGYYILTKPVRAGETPTYTYLGPEAPERA
jgi:hypothetical protein